MRTGSRWSDRDAVMVALCIVTAVGFTTQSGASAADATATISAAQVIAGLAVIAAQALAHSPLVLERRRRHDAQRSLSERVRVEQLRHVELPCEERT